MVVATRYAKSILVLAIENGKLEEVYADMKMIGRVCESNKDFVRMLESPLAKPDAKRNILRALFADNTTEITKKFLDLLTVKRREDYIPGICTSFVEQYKVYKDIMTAVITTATPLDQVSREQLLAIIKKTTSSTVEVVEKIDKGLIGGFKIKVGDIQIDSTVLRKLHDLKRDFAQNPFVKAM